MRKAMAFPIPQYSRKQVQRAGETLVIGSDPNDATISDEQWFEAYMVLTNWRACHGYPINTFQATLRNKLQKIDPDALVAQRLKRTPSIINKLVRFKGMNLARMQDIGGLRAVVSSLPLLRTLHLAYKETRFTHSLVSEFDYVTRPKPSGYRRGPRKTSAVA